MNKEPNNTTGTLQTEQVVYKNASLLVITDEEQKKLRKKVDPKLVEIRQDGLIYLPQVFWRDKLNEVFGRGQWALIIHKDSLLNDIMFVDGSLYIRGHFISRAIGEKDYHPNNPNESWATAWESAKSDCLTRCCKDLGIAKELWQPKFVTGWKEKYAIKVWIKDKTKPHWRRKDRAPLHNETKPVDETQPDITIKQLNNAAMQPKQESKTQNLNNADKKKKINDSPNKCRRIAILGNKLYGSDWQNEKEKAYLWAGGKSLKSSRHLTDEQKDKLINKLKAMKDEYSKGPAEISNAIKEIKTEEDLIRLKPKIKIMINLFNDKQAQNQLITELEKKETQIKTNVP